MTTLIIPNALPTGPLPLIPASWPRPGRTAAAPHRRRADLIGVTPGLRAVSTFPGVDLARTPLRRAEPGRPVTVTALLARIGGAR